MSHRLTDDSRNHATAWEERARFWEGQHSKLLESLPDAFYTCDLEGNLLSVNSAAERLSGFGRAEMLAMTIRQLMTAGSHTQLLQLAEEALAGKAPSAPVEFVAASGETVPVELHVTAVRDEQKPVAIQIIVHDLTASRRIEAAYRESQLRFRMMAKNIAEMVLAYDMDRRLIFANPAAQNLTGYSVAELEEAQFICWIHPDDQTRMLNVWDRVFEGQAFHEEIYRLTTKDGRQKWIEANWGPILDDAGRQIGVEGRERDITERLLTEESRRQAEERLRSDEEHYRTLFENSPFPLWEEDFSGVKAHLDALRFQGVANLRTYLSEKPAEIAEILRKVRIIDVNRAAREFYGASAKEELLGDLSRMFDEQAYEIFRDEICTLAGNNSLYRTEFQVRTLRGEQRTVTMIVSLVGASAESWSRAIVSFFDITDRVRLEESLLQSQKLESLGRLAGGVAHDFNNLLTVINGYADLVLMQLEEDHPSREPLNQIRLAGARGAELTQQLLAFGRKQISQPQTCDLNGLIVEMQPMLRRVLGENSQLLISLDSSLGAVRADRTQIHQVLMNLTVNGQEAMPEGGKLTIETRNVWVGFEVREEPGEPGAKPFVLLQVRDTGVGMDESTKKNLFEPFFTTKPFSKGAGLGLSTVFGIVSQNGGHISVQSEPGKGAAFSVYFPWVEGPPRPEAALPAPPKQAFQGSGTVLVVEDQEEVRRLVCYLLREFGFHVLEAAAGPEALRIIERLESPVRLLLTDVVMPGMNGRELAGRLTAMHPEIKVVFMSGYSDQIIGESGVIDRSVAYLPKPFTEEKLINILRQALG